MLKNLHIYIITINVHILTISGFWAANDRDGDLGVRCWNVPPLPQLPCLQRLFGLTWTMMGLILLVYSGPAQYYLCTSKRCICTSRQTGFASFDLGLTFEGLG